LGARVNATNVITVPRNAPQGSSGILPLDRIESPIVRQGLDYWRSLRGSRPYPSRAELVPRDLTALLRQVVLLRLVAGGADSE
jgi:hypothetical protein